MCSRVAGRDILCRRLRCTVRACQGPQPQRSLLEVDVPDNFQTFSADDGREVEGGADGEQDMR